PCRRPPSPARFPEVLAAFPAPHSAPPYPWLPTPGYPQSSRCDFPPADFRCTSTWPPCLALSAPAALLDRLSTHAFRSSASRRDNPPWEFRDHPAEADSSCS